MLHNQVTVVVSGEWFPPYPNDMHMDHFKYNYGEEIYHEMSNAICDYMLSNISDISVPNLLAHFQGLVLKNMTDSMTTYIYTVVSDEGLADEDGVYDELASRHYDIVIFSGLLQSVIYALFTAALSKVAQACVDMFYAHKTVPQLISVDISNYNVDYLTFSTYADGMRH